MARIQTPQHVQELQAEFKVREQFGLELLETVQPTYNLGDQKIASTGYPRKCMGEVAGAAGGAGTNVELCITCPADRGIVILLESIIIDNLAGRTDFRITDGVALATVQIADVATKAFRDGRLVDQLPDGLLQVFDPLTAAPNGRLIGRASCIANTSLPIELNIILGGGAYFLSRNPTANGAAACTYLWTEFLLEDR